jgi:hypothetical protein
MIAKDRVPIPGVKAFAIMKEAQGCQVKGLLGRV